MTSVYQAASLNFLAKGPAGDLNRFTIWFVVALLWDRPKQEIQCSAGRRRTIETQFAPKAGAPPPKVQGSRDGGRTRRRSLSNDEFLQKALEVFYERGFDGASIDAITAAAGIAKRTVYARYGDKENLFKTAIEHAIDDWNLPIERLREAEADNLEDSLFAIGQLLIDNILTPAGLRLLRLTNAESGRMPAIGEHNVRYGQDPVIAYLADLFRRQLPAGESFPDRAEAAEAFLHLVVGGPANAAAWGVVRDRATIARRARLSIGIFLRGVLAVSNDSAGTGEIDKARSEVGDLRKLMEETTSRLEKVSQALAAASGGKG